MSEPSGGDLFGRFVEERRVLKGVSRDTLDWYKDVRRAFQAVLQTPTRDGVMEAIHALRERGVSAVSVNTYLRGLKAYLRWAVEEGHLQEVPKVTFLKVEKKILATLSQEQIQRVAAYRPRGLAMTRTHVAALVMLDTGLRLSEVLGLRREAVDWENLVLRIVGKGGKHRLVPISMDLRRTLYRWVHRSWKDLEGSKDPSPTELVFGTRHGTRLDVRDFERCLSALGAQVGVTGVRFSPHTLRHTFAVTYLRNGGNLEFLRRCLGHSSILTTQRYLQSLGVEDLREVHDGLSPLRRR